MLAFFERLYDLGAQHQDLQYWSQATGLDMQTLVNTFEPLVNLGYLEQVPEQIQEQEAVQPDGSFESNKSTSAI